MRRSLNQLAAAQICRGLHFSGRVQSIGPRGDVCLAHVQLPTGDERHCWIPREDWHGTRPSVGDMVQGVADLRAYVHVDGEPGLSLGNARMLEVGQ